MQPAGSARWSRLQGASVGVCQVHVVLSDGEVFDGSMNVTNATGRCCTGYFTGDSDVTIAPSKLLGDGGI